MITITSFRVLNLGILSASFVSGISYANDTNPQEWVDRAVSGLVVGSKPEEVFVNMTILREAGSCALFLLLEQVDNRQVAANNLQESKIVKSLKVGEPNAKYLTEVGDVVFGIIQDNIEGRWPLKYLPFRITTRNNIKAWLLDRSKKSIKEMRIEAATLTLEKVRKHYATDFSFEALETIVIFEVRLEKIKNNEFPILLK